MASFFPNLNMKIDRRSAQAAHFMLEKICTAGSRHTFALKYNIFVLKISHGYMSV